MTRLVVASAPITFGRGCNELDYRIASSAVAIVVVVGPRATTGLVRRARAVLDTLRVGP